MTKSQFTFKTKVRKDNTIIAVHGGRDGKNKYLGTLTINDESAAHEFLTALEHVRSNRTEMIVERSN